MTRKNSISARFRPVFRSRAECARHISRLEEFGNREFRAGTPVRPFAVFSKYEAWLKKALSGKQVDSSMTEFQTEALKRKSV